MSDKNFGTLGTVFQQSLLKAIIEDRKYGEQIIDVIESKYFDNVSFRFICENIKEYFSKYSKIPNFESLTIKITSELGNIDNGRIHLDTLEGIKNNKEDNEIIKDEALNFCKQQNLKKELKKINSIIENGKFHEYPTIENIIQKALQVGLPVEESTDIFDDIDSALDTNNRETLPTGIEGLDNMLKGGIGRGELGIVLAPTGTGKAQPLTSKVLTPNGWKLMGDIEINDTVISSNGKPTKVLGVFPQENLRDVYIIKFNDGSKVECDIEHLWSVNTRNMRESKTRKNGKVINTPNNSFITLSLKDIIDGGIKKRGYLNYKIPVVKPIHFNKKDLLIDPYILGCLIGDGYFNRRSISTTDLEIVDYFIKNINCKIYDRTRSSNNKKLYEISLLNFKDKLSKYYDLSLKSENKFIHDDYLYNSIEVRLELLRGLMDTDGTVDKRGLSSYFTKSKRLAEDVVSLVKSLGGFATISEKESKYKKDNIQINCGKLFIVSLSLNEEIGSPFKLKRKEERYKHRTKYCGNKFISDIIYKGKEKTQCIFVEDESHEYITDDYIVTHNTTLLTKFSNTAYNYDFNVLQIFFEDNATNIKKKHFTIWTGIEPDELAHRKEEVKEIVNRNKSRSKGSLSILKLPSDSVTISDIKSRIRKHISDGKKVDLLVIDYVDCIAPEKTHFNEEWKGEGSVMRSLEAMTNEFNIAIWTATQGNRNSMSTEVVTTSQMGGSIKKAQIGHIVLSIGKTMEQKEQNLATITLLKSRIGQDGVIWNNCKFNNKLLEIDTETQTTLLGHKEEQVKSNLNRAVEVFKKRQELLNRN